MGQVWQAIKPKVAVTFIAGRKYLMTVIAEAFEKLVAERRVGS